MRGPLDPKNSGDYVRPNQAWQCDAETPCPLGPLVGGSCSRGTGCHPKQAGDRWLCNRSELRGGPCEAGPSPEGECCVQYQCTPTRSLRSRRGRLVIGILLGVTGAVLALLSSSYRNEALAPGMLTRPHAQLITTGRSEDRCVNCHAAGNGGFGEWWAHTTGGQPLQPSQSLLCMKCHEQTFSAEFALAAHNLPVASLCERTEQKHGSDAIGSGRIDSRNAIACAACHREHHGLDHNLTAIDNASCQACHVEQIDSFAMDHPEFATWPYREPTRITFDHASHSGKHYPKENQAFDCQQCHIEDGKGGISTLGYEASCAACHEQGISTSLADGVALVSLPTLDVDTLAEASVEIGEWPQEANFDFDGQLSPVTRLLLSTDPQALSAMQVLGAGFSFFDIDVDDQAQLEAVGDLIKSLKQLIAELEEQGPAAITSRAEQLAGRRLSKPESARFVGNLSPQVLRDYRQRWFGSKQASDSTSSIKASGTWKRVDASFGLKFHPAGHSDPWLRGWLDLAVESQGGQQQLVARQLLKEMFSPTSPGLCSTCHTAVRERDQIVKIHWQSLQTNSKPRAFTHFSHTPHLTQPRLQDCQSCHKLNQEGDKLIAGSGFGPLEKANCASCHTKQAAGESCTQCHNYHVDFTGAELEAYWPDHGSTKKLSSKSQDRLIRSELQR